jgi:ATP-dependent DNA helicase DinG
MTDYLDEVFGKGGLFAARFPGYEMRDGQVALSRMVDQAMREQRHALGEGPCGTGKGVAYGVPAVHHVHHHQKRVVIATANIALQEQLVTKDLPMLAEVLPWKFSFALLKGRNNYWCSDRAAESEARGELSGLYDDHQDRQMDAVLAWAKATATGDMSELPFVPLPQVWSKVSVGSDECKGEGCRFRETCFSERAKETAKAADIVVTNYHLLFAHLAVRRETGQDLVLPPFDHLVLDEAHEAAEIARDFFGFSVSEHGVGRLARYAADFGDKKLADRLRREAEEFFARVASFARSPAYRRRLKKEEFVSPVRLAGELHSLSALAAARQEDEALKREDRATARNAHRAALTTITRVSEAVYQSDREKVYWIDLDGKGRARLKGKPIDVSATLRAELFEKTDSVTLVSATLTTAGTFDFVRRELGVPEGALEVVAETPFDFEKQALLVVPEGLPDPREPAFVEAVTDVVKRVIELCDGRTLGLFTSYKNLNAVYERVVGNGHRVLRQGELPRVELTRIFKEDISSVLLGTDSFWTGIDVPGEALTGLVIDKLPFPHPEDPVVDAICERDPRAFQNYLVPCAIITLRQGVGRLIRSQQDVGVVVILDRRIAEKSYGRQFLKSLPPMLTTRRLENISHFLGEARDARAG